jgi:hypothetical protein
MLRLIIWPTIVIANILSSLAGKPLTAQYKGSIELMVVTNGKVHLHTQGVDIYISSNFCLYFDRTLCTLAFFWNHDWHLVCQDDERERSYDPCCKERGRAHII